MTRMPPWWPMMEPPLPSEEPVVTEDEQVAWDTSRTAAFSRLFPANAGSAHEGKSAVWVYRNPNGTIGMVDHNVLSERPILGYDPASIIDRRLSDPDEYDPDTADCG